MKFSDKLKLENEFYVWLKQHAIDLMMKGDCVELENRPVNFITFLMEKGVIK